MPTFIDQLGNSITLTDTPKRIVSIVPSQSELLWDIGAAGQLVGITKFCIHPKEMFTSVERVGGTKNLDIEKIRALRPDLIIGNKEENEKSQVEQLQKEFNVWMSDIYNFTDALDMMTRLGEITGRVYEAEKIVRRINSSLPEVKGIFNNQKIIYFIWKNPYMVAASNTYINHVINYLGLQNAAGKQRRYPEFSADELANLAPEYCLLSSEPYPFKEKHAREIEGLIPGTKAIIVDGEMFSWYGSHLQQLPEYIKELKQKLV